MKILLTGGSGFIGRHLQIYLKRQGHDVHLLSRHPKHSNTHTWDIYKKHLSPAALENTEVIIHLAGANIGAARWTAARKKEIIESRTKSTELLFEKLQTTKHPVKTFIAATAVGIYGNSGDRLVSEDDNGGEGFLAEVCHAWEASVKRIETLGIRTVMLRQGIVLGAEDGALPKMTTPVKFLVGAPLGSGKQYLSWIHIDDLCRLYNFAINNPKFQGIFNAASSHPVSNRDFTRSIAATIHRPLWPFNVPASLLKIVLGELATMILEGQKVSNKKILAEGFTFQYDDLNSALKNLLI